MAWSWKGEKLIDHVKLVYELGLELFPEEVELFNRRAGHDKAWAFVALLHDAGKLHRDYQKRPETFYCHEVYSALVAYETLKNVMWPWPVVLAVLLHHHFMDRVGDCLNKTKLFDPVDDAEYEKFFNSFTGIELKLPRLAGAHLNKLLGKASDNDYYIAQIALGVLVIVDNLAGRRRANDDKKRIILEALCSERPDLVVKAAQMGIQYRCQNNTV